MFNNLRELITNLPDERIAGSIWLNKDGKMVRLFALIVDMPSVMLLRIVK